MTPTDTTLETTLPVEAVVAEAAGSDYSEKDIQVLKDADHIRKNPGVYIGDVTKDGLHHLVYEVVHNSIDEAMAGYCKNIEVRLNLDGSISIADDGRGIPVEMHPTEGRSTLELVMCVVGAGGKFHKETYKISGGLHGMGIKAVNALSEWTEVEVRRNGTIYQQSYERGKPASDLREVGKSKATGTKITFKPDDLFFQNVPFDYDTIENRLRELAFLNKGLAILLIDERTDETRKEAFKYDGGLQEYVEYINRADEPLHKCLYMEELRDDIFVEAAFQYIGSDEERVSGFTNNIRNRFGGTHLSGFRTALTRTVNQYGYKTGLIKENMTLTGEDFREGLTALLSLRVPKPIFSNQAKERLLNPEIDGIVAGIVSDYLARYLEENPAIAKRMVQKVALAAEAREAAAKARKATKDRKNILSGGGLPGKLMDCTSKNRDECELFLVEGDSAGGSADGGRERLFQAILPMRGKILNVEKARLEKMLDNTEICNIISAIGTDIAEAEDVSKRNYDKIIVLTDADVDGSHIRTLLLTFLFRQMPKMVAEGHIYLAQPPLYRVIQRKTVRYVQTAEILHRDLMQRGLQGTRLQIVDGGKIIEGENLQPLVEAVAAVEHSLIILDRRGLGLALLLSHAKNGVLPSHRVQVDHAEHWFANADEVTAFCQAEQAKRGEAAGNGKDALQVLELHEVKSINRGLEKLREVGLDAGCLLPPKAVGGREPAPRFFLDHDGSRRPLHHLRELAVEIRHLGEKGMTITRFKGLGEMNPDELWDTTLDPARRVLMKVRLDDAFKADELFRILMGEKVEPRREFIEKHALEVRNLDV